MAATLLIALLAGLPAAQAQSQEERDRSFIVALLEDNLSDAGRDIRIEGFKGLLSAQARLESLTISDDQGVWFTLEDAALDWTRSALLKGRLAVNSITAQSVILHRKPDVPRAPASPEAQAFSLPQLPISIELGEIKVAQLVLGADVLGLGEETAFTLDGKATLADGSGAASLSIVRTQGVEGRFALDASYANESKALEVDISLEEGAQGLISTLADIPDHPALKLTVKGSGTLDDFAADLDVAAADAQQISGRFGLVKQAAPSGEDLTTRTTPLEDAPHLFELDITGDPRAFLKADYAAFFGADSHVHAQGQRDATGALRLDELTVQTNAIHLDGAAAFAPNGTPTSFALDLDLTEPSGAPVLLPLAGPPIYVDTAQINAFYDAAQNENWTLDGNLIGFASEGMSLGAARLQGGGTIERNADGANTINVRGVSAQMALQLAGIDWSDAAIEQAVGDALNATVTLDWQEDHPLRISSLDVNSAGFAATGQGTFDWIAGVAEANELAFVGGFDAQFEDLSRFAALSGQRLSGAANLRADGSVFPLSGGFDLTVSGTARALKIGQEYVDAVLVGDTDFTAKATRDAAGLLLERTTLTTRAITLEANGRLSSSDGVISASANLDDISRLDLGLSGPVSIQADLAGAGPSGLWQTTAWMTGPAGAEIALNGTLAADLSETDITLRGTASMGLANGFTTAALTSGTAAMNMRLAGGMAVENASGTIDIVDGAKLVIPAANAAFTLRNSRINIAQGDANLQAVLTAQKGGSITLDGRIGLSGGLPVNMAAQLNDVTVEKPSLLSTQLDGQIALTGALTSGAKLSGALALGDTEVRVSPTAFGEGGGILDVTHVGASSGVQSTRRQAGVLAEANASQSALPSISIDVTVDAPNRIFLRGRGLDAEMGGRVHIGGTSDNLIPSGGFELIRGRLSLLGKRIELTEGLLTLEGDTDPQFRVVGQAATEDLTINIIIEGQASNPQVLFTSSPQLPDEEVLSRLLFGQDISEISILQAAKLAAAVQTLTGGGNGISDKVRRSFGLDDIDLTTAEDGSAALKVGKYISENIYTDITIDSAGKSEINLNLDASDDVTFKGTYTSEGNTSLGVFFERDY